MRLHLPILLVGVALGLGSGCGSVSSTNDGGAGTGGGGTGGSGTGHGGASGGAGSDGTGGAGFGGIGGGPGGHGGGNAGSGGHGGAATGGGGGSACAACTQPNVDVAACPSDVATANMCPSSGATCCAGDQQWHCGNCVAETCHWTQYCSAGAAGSGGATGAGGGAVGTGGIIGSGGAAGSSRGGASGAAGMAGAGGFASGGGGGSTSHSECTQTSDCILHDDCCACASVPKTNPGATCNIACGTGQCTSRGITAADVTCMAGRCVLARSCNPKNVACTLAPPACSAGSLPAIAGGCYSGGCLPVAQCSEVPSCDSCTTAGLACVTDEVLGGPTFHCVTVPSVCSGAPACQCLGVCTGAFQCTDPASTSPICQCPAC
jgi:hypothetical protein